MNILDQLEARISQLLDNMSLMQMEIDELTEKNQYLQEKITQSENLENEVIKIRAEQALWHERLQQLLGKIEDVTLQEDSPSTQVSKEIYCTQKTQDIQGTVTEKSSASRVNELELTVDLNPGFNPDFNATSEYSQSEFNAQENSTNEQRQFPEDEIPFFEINQNFIPDEPVSEYQKKQPLL